MRRISRAASAVLPLLGVVALPARAAVVEGVELRLLANGFDEPVALANAGDDRVFVVEQAGRIRVFADGAIAGTPFLDIRSRVQFGGERGLLGLAFHPDYAENGRFFVDYTREPDGATVISRFTRSALDPDRADPGSEAILLVIPQPYENHNGGQLAFGPDGRLWVATGDGGAGGDPQCRAQNVDDRLGKLLRLDVDSHADAPPYHAPAAGNPFLAGPGDDLVWAFGLRNPWRFSFDRRLDGLWIADVGQGEFDEIDIAGDDGAPGVNWGWKVMEAHACFSREGCPPSTPACGDESLYLPDVVLPLTEGRCAVIGGYVYRGHRLPALEGRYLFGDHCTGDLWALRGSAGGLVRDDLPFDLPTLTTFAETRTGEILLATLTGELYTLDRPIASACVPSASRACLAGGRFAVEVSVRDYALERRDARIVVQGPGSVLFWYFHEDVWEQVVKVIDGCGFNQRYWVYAAAATDVETVLRVTDATHGVVREYVNSLGVEAPALTDSSAFATCN